MELQKDLAAIRARNAEVHVIGSGTPNFIEGFREETKWDGPTYSDPSLASFRAAELKRSMTSTLDPRSLGKAFSAFRSGHRQGRTQGDAWQQGGVVVVKPDGTIAWHQASSRPGDNASNAEILAALK